jgi:hypothetical protein
MMFAASANDFAMFFVSIELITITFYVLTSFQRNRLISLEAGCCRTWTREPVQGPERLRQSKFCDYPYGGKSTGPALACRNCVDAHNQRRPISKHLQEPAPRAITPRRYRGNIAPSVAANFPECPT